MDLLSLFRLLWRRKWIVIPTTLVAVGLMVATVVIVPPTYRASSSLILLNPPRAPEPELGQAVDPSFQNPYVGFGDISVVVDIIRRVMTSDPVANSLIADGLVGTFTVAANVDFARGPIIDVASEAPSGADAIANVNLVSAELGRQLAQLQTDRGTDPTYFITAQVVVPPTRATTVFSSTLRRLIAVGALGGAFVIGSAIIADAFSRRRRRKQKLGADGKLAPPELEPRGSL